MEGGVRDGVVAPLASPVMSFVPLDLPFPLTLRLDVTFWILCYYMSCPKPHIKDQGTGDKYRVGWWPSGIDDDGAHVPAPRHQGPRGPAPLHDYRR